MKTISVFLTILVLAVVFTAATQCAQAQITYPVDVENDRFTVIKDGEVVDRGRLWPRADGMEIAELPANVVLLKEVIAPLPAFDPATQKLGPGEWTDNIPNETATFARPVVALTTEELAEVAAQTDREAKAVNLQAGIATLRSWADDAAGTTVTSGNAVATLQVVVNRLGVFFDNFADLLEVQRIGE